jgi:hypothetical protein
MGSRRAPTERDRFWLDHERAIAKSGQSAKAYAAAQGLSLHALYQARKRLKALGHLPTGRVAPGKERRTRSGSAVAFSKIEVASSPARDLGYRLSLPSGLVFEWSGGEVPDLVVDLLERLAQPR